MTDARTLKVPLWGAILSAGTVVSVLVGIVVWVFANFPTKVDSAAKLENHEQRILKLEQNWSEIKSDLSYIRGRLEPKP